MQERPTFTAVITSYNYRRFIAEAIDSALAQTRAPSRIVVVDDGSSDGSADYVRQRYASEPSVQLVQQANQGQLRAFATGIDQAGEHDVIAFLDADDRWETGYLEAVAAVLIALPQIDYVYANMRFFGDRGGTYHHRARSGSDGLSVLAGCYARSWRTSPTSGVCIRRPLARRLALLPDAMASAWRTRADDCLSYGADVLGGRKFYLSPALSCYRVHGNNLYLGREDDPAAAQAHSRKVDALVAHYCAQAGINLEQAAEHCRGALEEFRTKPDPVRSDLKRYLRLADLADLTAAQRWIVRTKMWLHYLGGRASGARRHQRSAPLRYPAKAGE
jgi:glycosyltransferase involved in cell wall biosynthesis